MNMLDGIVCTPEAKNPTIGLAPRNGVEAVYCLSHEIKNTLDCRSKSLQDSEISPGFHI